MNRSTLKGKFSKVSIMMLAVLLVAFFFGCNAPQNTPEQMDESGNYTALAAYGATIKYVPANLPGSGVPVVVAMHGCSQSATDYQVSTGWNKVADQFKFIVIYPHKTSGTILNCWDHANTSTGDPTNDMNYILSEINKVKTAHPNVDSTRIFVTGLSSGGGLAYCFAEQHYDKIAGFAPMAAPVCKNKYGNPKDAKMIIWHSTSDSASAGTIGFPRFGDRYTGATKTITNGKLKEGHSGHKYEAYTKNGEAVVGMVTMSMSHGIAVDPGSGEDQGGDSSKGFTYDMDIHSSYYTAKFWGLDGGSVIPGDPSVTLTSPAKGASVAGTISITADATDKEGIAKVEFFVGGALKCTDTTAPYSCSLDTTGYAEGTSLQISALAYDTDNKTAADALTVTVRNTFSCQEYTAKNVDHVAAGRAETYTQYTLAYAKTVGAGNDLGQLGTTTYSATTTVAETSPGYFIKGNCPVNPGNDSTPPAVSISAPADGASIAGTVTIKANATDNVGVTKVEFYINGFMVSADTTAPYEYAFDTTTVANLPHTLSAKAFDAAGNVAEASIGVTINNGGFVCKTYTAKNTEHVAAGRAVTYKQFYSTYVKTVGSGESLGSLGSTWYSATTSVKETSPGYFAKGTCN